MTPKTTGIKKLVAQKLELAKSKLFVVCLLTVKANNLFLNVNFVPTLHLDVEVFDCSLLAPVKEKDSETITTRMKEIKLCMFISISRDCCG